MSTENLKVVITGDASDLDQTSSKASAALKKVSISAAEYQKRAKELGVSLSNVSAIEKSFSNTAAATSRNIESSSRSLQQMGKTSSSATNSLFALSGVVQDAPYGFRAIANNITFFTQQMAYSSKEAGGFSGAIKAMGKSFLGPAGIIFAISATTSLLDYFLNRATRGEQDIDEFKKSIDDLKGSVKTVGDAFASGLSGSAKRLTNLNLLYNATQNLNLSTQDRIKAANQLKTTEKDAFKDFSSHAIVVGKAAIAYSNLTNNIIKYATAQGLANEISQNAQKQFEIQGKILDLSDKINNAKSKNQAGIDSFNKVFEKLFPDSDIKSLQGRIGKVNEFLRSPSNVNTAISSGLINKSDINSLRGLSAVLSDTGVQVQKYSDQINALSETYGDFFKKNKQLEGFINVSDIIDGGKGGSGTGGKGVKTITTEIQALEKQFRAIDFQAQALHLSLDEIQKLKFDAVTDAIKNIGELGVKPTNDQLRELIRLRDGLSIKPIQPIGIQGITNIGLDGQFKKNNSVGGTNNPFNVAPPDDDWAKFFDNNTEYTQNWAKAARTLDGTFQSIFTTLASGGNIFDALKQAVIGLIAQLAAAAAAAAVLAALTGGGSQAFGAIFSGLSGIPKFAGGGFIPGPTLAVVGDAPGGEWVLNQKQISAILSGGGGNRNINVGGELRLRGNDLVAAIRRTNDSNNEVL